jgi:hypothetical protein
MVVASVMIINLIIILLYSIIIANYQNLKELIIATVIYSITILTLISNTNHIDQISKSSSYFKSKIAIYLVFIFALIVSSGGFYLIKNIDKILPRKTSSSQLTLEKIMNKPQSLANNNNINQNLDAEQKEIKNNVLFKRSTDAILIIVGIMTVLLLSSKYRNQESNI